MIMPARPKILNLVAKRKLMAKKTVTKEVGASASINKKPLTAKQIQNKKDIKRIQRNWDNHQAQLQINRENEIVKEMINLSKRQSKK